MIVPAPTDRAVEVILFVGFPASGKSSFYSRYFKPASYVHVVRHPLPPFSRSQLTNARRIKIS